VFALVLGAVSVMPAWAPEARLYIAEPSMSAEIGDPLTFNIKIDDAFAVYAWELRLVLDTDILRVDSCVKGNIFADSEEGSFFVYRKFPGYIDMGETAIGGYGGAAGDFTLAKVKVTVQDIGKAELAIEKSLLIDRFETHLPHTVDPGPTIDVHGDWLALPNFYAELREKKVDNRHWDISVMGTTFTYYGKAFNLADVPLWARIKFTGSKDGEVHTVVTNSYLHQPGEMSPPFLTSTTELTLNDIGYYELKCYAEFSYAGFKYYENPLGMSKDLSFLIEA